MNNYEYLKLKFFFTATTNPSIKTSKCWEYLNEMEFLEIIQLIADSADPGKTRRALEEIEAVPPGRIPKNVYNKLEVIKKLALYNQFNPEVANIQVDTEKTVKFKIRVYGYDEIVMKSCENCVHQSSYIK